ncbi:MAG TPA: hypothetical protein VK590_11555 [Saprospiraceae bacterium]|nr:hypothetical protein [Saprospiraceae bacterium]
MNKSTQDSSPIQSQVEQLAKQIQACKNFIDGEDLCVSALVIFNKHKELPQEILIPHEQFSDLSFPTLNFLALFVQSLGDDLYAKKLLLEQKAETITIDQLAVFQKELKKNSE